MHFRRNRLFISIMVLAILLAPIGPVFSASSLSAVNIEVAPVLPPATVNKVAADALPAFPEDLARPPTDWSALDWTEKITPLFALDQYHKQVSRLAEAGKLEELANLAKPEQYLSDEEVLSLYQAPAPVRQIVRAQRANLQSPDSERRQMALRVTRAALAAAGFKPAAEPAKPKAEAVIKPGLKEKPASVLEDYPRIDLSKLKKINSKNVRFLEPIPTVPASLTISNQRFLIENQWRDVTADGLSVTGTLNFGGAADLTGRENSLDRLSKSIKSYFFGLPARAAGPFISYYAGIEENILDQALYYLSQTQSQDGSFGAYNQYVQSAEVFFQLARFRRTDSDQFQALSSYLNSAAPQNIREKALKARYLVANSQSAQALLDEIIARQNDDGGFGLDQYYKSDMETTLEVALALAAANYGVPTALPGALSFIISRLDQEGAIRFSPDSDPSYYLTAKTAKYLKPFANLNVVDTVSGASVAIQSKLDQLEQFLSSRYDSASGRLLGSDSAVDYALTISVLDSVDANTSTAAGLKVFLKDQPYADGSFEQSPLATIWAMAALAQPDLVITDLTAPGSRINGQEVAFTLNIENRGYKRADAANLYLFVDKVKLPLEWSFARNGVSLEPNQAANLNLTVADTRGFINNTEITFYLEDQNELIFDDQNWLTRVLNFAPSAAGVPALPLYVTAHKSVSGVVPQADVAASWAYKPDANRRAYIFAVRITGSGNSWDFYGINTNYTGVILGGGFNEAVDYDIGIGVWHSDGSITLHPDITVVRASADENRYNATLSAILTEDYTRVSDAHLNGRGVDGNTDADGQIEFAPIGNGSTAVWTNEPRFESYLTRVAVPIDARVQTRVFTHLKPDNQNPAVTALYIQNVPALGLKNQRTVTVQAQATDNVAIKEIEVDYWDPAQNIWIFLASEEFKNQSITLFYDWYIPANLLGSGHKLKAVATDWRGNRSAELEWGPFALRDGTIPTGEINPNLNNNQWPLGATQAISWLVSSTSPVANYGSLRLVLPSFSQSLTTPQPNDTRFDYTIPFDSIYLAAAAYLAMDICDTNDNCGELRSAEFAIVDNRPPPAEGRIYIDNLTLAGWPLGQTYNVRWQLNSSLPSVDIRDLKLHFGASELSIISGSVPAGVTSHVFAMPIDSNYAAPGAYITLEVCGTTGRCVLIESDHFDITDTTPPPTPPWNEPAPTSFVLEAPGISRLLRAIFSDGSATTEIVYEELEGYVWQTGGQNRRIVYRQLVNGVWGQTAMLKDHNYQNNRPETEDLNFSNFSVDRSAPGDIHLAYNEYAALSDTFAQLDSYQVRYLHWRQGQLVSDRQISSHASRASASRLLVGANGQAHILWAQGYSYVARTGVTILRYLTGDGVSTWQAEQALNSVNSSVPAAVLENNELAVVYASDDQLYFIKQNGSVWTSPLVLNNPEVRREYLDVFTADAARLALIVTPHPTDPRKYLWLPTIRRAADLRQILSSNNFVEQSRIMDVWSNNEFGYSDPSDKILFALGNSTYDLFYRQVNQFSNWNNELKQARVSVNIGQASHTVVIARSVVDRVGRENVSDYVIVRRSDGRYHLLYGRLDQGRYGRWPYLRHALITDNSTYFDGLVTRQSMRFLGFVAARESQDRVSVHFNAYKEGAARIMTNTADFGNIINYRLDNSMAVMTNLPADVLLDWSYDGGPIDDFTVLLGSSRYNLSPIASGLNSQTTAYQLVNLNPNTTHYWQIIGRYQGREIYSNVWRFTTALDFIPPRVGPLSVSARRITDFMDSVSVSAEVTGNVAPIAAAEYYVLDKTMSASAAPALGAGQAMSATDGSFNAVNETITATIDTSAWTVANSPYTIGARARSTAGLWSAVTTTEVRVDPFTFKSLTVSQTILPADGATLQTATLVLHADDETEVSDVRIFVNDPRNNNGQPSRGYFRYRYGQGFDEAGVGYGNDVVAIDAAQSRASFDAATKEMTLVYAWVAEEYYAAVPDNDLTYWWAELGRDVGHVDTSFAVTSSRSLASFNTLSVNPTLILANGREHLAVDVVINTTDPRAPGEVSLIINYDQGEADFRGRMAWSAVAGWREVGGNYWGNQYITLLPQDASNSAAGSQTLVDPAAGTLTLRFRLRVNATYGERLRNTLTYGWRDTAGLILADPTFAVAAAATAPTFAAFTVDKSNQLANSQDVQTARLTINTTDPAYVDYAVLIINRVGAGGNPADMRGYFRWNGNNFVEGSSYFGTGHVNLLPMNASNSPAGSQRLIDAAAGTLNYVFRWTANPSYGAVPDNDITHQFGHAANQDFSPLTLEQTNYAVTAPVAPPAFQSLTVDKQTQLADGSDIQTARLTMRVADPAHIDKVSIIINRDPINTANMRGRMEWNPANGFYESGAAAYFGNNHITLLPAGSVGSPNNSYREVSGNTVTFVFRWTANPSYGAVPDNDLTYSFHDALSNRSSPLTRIDTSYAVSGANQSRPPSFNNLTVAKQIQVANRQDIQSAVLVIDAANPSEIDFAALIINRQRGITSGPENMRGRLQWRPGIGFHEAGGSYFGNQHVNLITTGPDASTIQLSGQQAIITFRWTANPSYGAVSDNDLSYSFGARLPAGYLVPMTEVDTSYAVTL